MFTEKTLYTLEKLGFTESSHGVYHNEHGTVKIILSGEGLKGFSVSRGFVDEEDDYLELSLNFIPGDYPGDLIFLEKLLRRTFHL